MYKPSLDDYISQCEINYCLVVKLFPYLSQAKYEKIEALNSANKNLAKVDVRERLNHVKSGQDGPKQAVVKLRLVESTTYTSTLEIIFKRPTKIVKGRFSLLARLYHDGKMLEVMDGTSTSELRAIEADQPENLRKVKLDKSKSLDEKRQMSQLLGESLAFCLNHSLPETDEKK